MTDIINKNTKHKKTRENSYPTIPLNLPLLHINQHHRATLFSTLQSAPRNLKNKTAHLTNHPKFSKKALHSNPKTSSQLSSLTPSDAYLPTSCLHTRAISRLSLSLLWPAFEASLVRGLSTRLNRGKDTSHRKGV